MSTGSPLDETLRGVGVRRDWSHVPSQVQQGIEQVLGAGVVEAEAQPEGFSPGVAARVRLSDGRRVFIKASGAELNPDSPEINRREASVASRLPMGVPAPRLLSSYDERGWVALVFEDVCARPPHLPWRRPELDRVVAAVVALSTSHTPSPIRLDPIFERAEGFAGFQALRAMSAEGEDLQALDPGIARISTGLLISTTLGRKRRAARRCCIWTSRLTTCWSRTNASCSSTGHGPRWARRGLTSFSCCRASPCKVVPRHGTYSTETRWRTIQIPSQ